eukprot:c19170_g1_i1 orf=481-729(+)
MPSLVAIAAATYAASVQDSATLSCFFTLPRRNDSRLWCAEASAISIWEHASGDHLEPASIRTRSLHQSIHCAEKTAVGVVTP